MNATAFNPPIRDAELRTAGANYQRALQMLHGTGPDATDAQDAPGWALLEPADAQICRIPATTAAGAAVKLRRALQITEAGNQWVEKGLCEGNDTIILEHSHEYDYESRLIADALAALLQIDQMPCQTATLISEIDEALALACNAQTALDAVVRYGDELSANADTDTVRRMPIAEMAYLASDQIRRACDVLNKAQGGLAQIARDERGETA
jgi:hypothetical protein